MTALRIHNASALCGNVLVPGDKSISHRSLLLGALAEGESRIEGFLPSGDCMATLACVRSLGVNISQPDETSVVIQGAGLSGLHKPAKPLNCLRSGTTMRLLAGILAGQTFDSVLTGSPQLLRRPMRRITEPLGKMGAQIVHTDGCAPLSINGCLLHGSEHHLQIASAQVKSAILLAGLYAQGVTIVHQPGPARDHTERMLAAQIVEKIPGKKAIQYGEQSITLQPALLDHLAPLNLKVPGDISSASFLIVASLLIPGSDVTITDVGMNPTRTGIVDVLREMGANIKFLDVHEQQGEPVATVRVRSSRLTGTGISGSTVVRMIDEFPILAVAATQAHGKTLVRDAAELRVKETDRIDAIVQSLTQMGAKIEGCPDGFVVEGPTRLHGYSVKSYHDHRLAMALTVAGLVAEGDTTLQDAECIADSFPGFEALLKKLGADLDASQV
jgi:3-phosphoshikimate 1-carboxyvinyltransferase